MKIAFFADAGSVHSKRWIQFFFDRGIEVLWFSANKACADAEALCNKVSYVELSRAPSLTQNRFKAFCFLPRAISSARRAVAAFQPDIVHAHSAGIDGLLASIVNGRAKVLTPWGSDILLASGIRKLFLKRVLSSYQHFTCDGLNTKKALIKLGVPESDISFIRFGVDVEGIEPKESGVESKEQLVVVSLRSLESVYDIETLVLAAEIVLAKYQNIRFEIYGSGSEESKLKLLAESKGLLKRRKLAFKGSYRSEQLAAILHSADIYVSTSLSDSGLAASTAEAMAAGLPVIVSRSGDNEHWVEEGKGGVLFELRDYGSLAKAISFLAEAPVIRNKYGEFNRELILKKNNYRIEMEKMLQIYESLTNNY